AREFLKERTASA
ncbi:hypothetical protein CISIN_1g0218231mg, partial [Citrus sinensis]